MNQKLLVVDCAGFSYELLSQAPATTLLNQAYQGVCRRFYPTFPAVTCSVQASLLTRQFPSSHGIVGNGFFNRASLSPVFWNQSYQLLDSTTLLKRLVQQKKGVAQLFWQNSLGSPAHYILTPKPIHKHHGGLLPFCYSKPKDLYPKLCQFLGPFKLSWYWGPFTSFRSTQWIQKATLYVMQAYHPDLVLTYLPHLDYALQRSGPSSTALKKDIALLDQVIQGLWEEAERLGYAILLFSDYSIGAIEKVISPNAILKEAGLFSTYRAGPYAYPDYAQSGAFALVDHQIAHVYCQSEEMVQEARHLLQKQPGVEQVLGRQEQESWGVAHERSGDLVVMADESTWFYYGWWTRAHNEPLPDYARHVDIHNKMGYDPCELFFKLFPHPGISLDPSQVRGSHGRKPTRPEQAGFFIYSEPGADISESMDPFTLHDFMNRFFNLYSP